MSNLNTCSNEKLSFKYSDEWELEEVPLENNPDCIATLSYEDGSLLNVIAFQSEMPSLDDFKEIIERCNTSQFVFTFPIQHRLE